MQFIKNHRRNLLIIALLSCMIFIAQSIAWPIIQGRDYSSYMNYYVSICDKEPAYQFLMLYRPMLSCIFIGSVMQYGGPLIYELVLGLLFTISILAVYYIGNMWNRKVAIVSAAMVLFYPSYGAFFHEIQSDNLMSCAFLLWCVFICHTYQHPTCKKFIFHGVIIFILTIIRPTSQVFILFAVFPFLLTEFSSRKKIICAASVILPALSLFLLFATYNQIRYNDFTVTRGGNILFFSKAFFYQRIVKPENGPASQELATAVEKDLLLKEPYLSYQISLEDVFSPPYENKNARIGYDIISLCDRTWGWDSDYKKMRQVGLEAIKTYPLHFAKYLVFDAIELLIVDYRPPYHSIEKKSAKQTLNELGLVVPTERQLIPYAYMGLCETNDQYTKTSNDKIDGVKRKISTANLDIQLPTRNGNTNVASFFNTVSKIYPKMIVFVLLGLIVLSFCKKDSKRDRSTLLLFLCALSLLPVSVIVISNILTPHYRLPYDPIFIITGVAAVIRAKFDC